MAMGATNEALLLTMMSSNPVITIRMRGRMIVLNAFLRLDCGLDILQRYLSHCLFIAAGPSIFYRFLLPFLKFSHYVKTFSFLRRIFCFAAKPWLQR
jgi:hypothetical protein